MALVIEIADALVAVLNAEDFTQSFTATRRVRPSFEGVDMGDLHVTVTPRSFEAILVSRSVSQYDVQIDIGVQMKLPVDEDEDYGVANMCGLVEEIADFLDGKQLTGTGWKAAWLGPATNDPIYSTDHLAEKRLFTSVLTMTYRVLK